jgi:vitamin B12/bleomycin/antimicrobial peptide transport system ATP-binding/permease protein
MTHPYWFSEDRWAARGLLLVVIALHLGIVYINVLLNEWNNTFYDALQDKDCGVFQHQLIRFSWMAGLFIRFAVYQSYLNQMLQIRWRRWLTDRYLRAWLKTECAYYRMQFVAGGPTTLANASLRIFVCLFPVPSISPSAACARL